MKKLDIFAAHQRIRSYLKPTPLIYSHSLSRKGAQEVFLKPELQQASGSFKIRGVLNKVLQNSHARAFTAASTGNHGLAFGYVMQRLQLQGEVVLPKTISNAKKQLFREWEIPHSFVGDDCVEAEIKARQIPGGIYVSPYNDTEVIEGQGTVALEIMEEEPGVDTIICPVGGGGLVSGILSCVKKYHPDVHVIGCQPENSAEMYHYLQVGKIVEHVPTKPTLSDATAGALEPGSITYDICQKWLDDLILIPEEQIAEAIVWMLRHHHLLIEGAAALPVAALMYNRIEGKKVVAIITGKRLSESGFSHLSATL